MEEEGTPGKVELILENRVLVSSQAGSWGSWRGLRVESADQRAGSVVSWQNLTTSRRTLGAGSDSWTHVSALSSGSVISGLVGGSLT